MSEAVVLKTIMKIRDEPAKMRFDRTCVANTAVNTRYRISAAPRGHCQRRLSKVPKPNPLRRRARNYLIQ